MNPRPTLSWLGAWAILSSGGLAVAADRAPAIPAPASATASDRDSVQDVIFLTDARPVFLRLKLDAGGKSFRSAWLDSVKSLHAYLDRDGDGILTRQEAEKGSLPAMVRAATGGASALPRADLDTNPKDGKVSVEELADVLRPALGPFRVQVGKLASEKADALFNHLDRDKDGHLTKQEMGAAVASLRRFDLDDDEMVAPNEIDPFSNPIAMQQDDMAGRRGKFAVVPPVIELSSEDPSFRPVRLLLKKYDRGTVEGAAAGDNRLSRGEFAIDAREFDKADTDHDDLLDTEELRRYLGQVGPDLEMTVKLAGASASAASIEVSGAGAKPLPPGVKVERLGPGDVEVSIGEISLEFHADAGEKAVENARGYYEAQFRAADADNNMYLEKGTEVKDHGPFYALFELMDRDGDGKLYLKEVVAFVDRQAEAARSQMVMSASDQGRAIFAIMDLNRDRLLGAREIRGTVPRVSSWDRNGDGKVSADEIPHHYQLTIGRGRLTPMTGQAVAVPETMEPAASAAAESGPVWFRRMDRNRDGDVSRREFLGPRSVFDRLDRDGDGLINADEAAAAKG